MKEEMIKKVEELFSSGKITEEVKEKLIQEIEKIEEKKGFESKKRYKEVEFDLIFEDVEIVGKEEQQNIVFEYGREGVDIEESENKLLIKSKSRGVHINVFGFKIGTEIYTEKIKLYIPKNINLIVNDISGNINIKNINGSFKIKGISGNVEIENISGDGYIYTISGDIECNLIKGNFNISSKSGDISFNDSELSGNIKTYSGDIEIKDGNFEKVSISTFSGDCYLKKINFNDSMDIKTMSGDVDISLLTKDLKVIVDSKSGEGRISYQGKETKIGKGEMSFGFGGKKLFIKTYSGDVDITID